MWFNLLETKLLQYVAQSLEIIKSSLSNVGPDCSLKVPLNIYLMENVEEKQPI